VHVILWVIRHDRELPHGFVEWDAHREIYSLVNHRYFDSSRIGKQANSMRVNWGCFIHGCPIDSVSGFERGLWTPGKNRTAVEQKEQSQEQQED
jgi:hypothetical protein